MKNRKLIGLFTGFTLLILSLIWIQVVQQHRTDKQAALTTVVQRNDNLVAALEQYTIRTLRNVNAVLQKVKQEYEIGGLTSSQKLAEYALECDFFNELAIVDEQGKLLTSSHAAVQAGSLSAMEAQALTYHRQNPDSDLYISRPFLSPLLQKTMILVSGRLTRPDGRFGGIVAMQIEPATFTRFYADARLHQHDIISLIAPDGITYARRTGPLESHSEDIHKSPLFNHIKQRPVGDYFAKDAIRNIPTYFSYRQLKAYPIIATVGTSETNALASYRASARRDYIFATSISLLILLFSISSCVALQHRKRINEKVKESEVKYRSIVENSHDVILLVRPDGSIQACNPAACKAFLLDEAALLQKSLSDLMAVQSTEVEGCVQQALTARTYQNELGFVRSDGTVFMGELKTSLYTNAAGKENVTIIIRDITERQRLAAKLQQEQRRFQQKLTRQVILAQEREREEIGRELHDNVNQVLTTVKLYLEMANGDVEMSSVLVPKSIHLVSQSINEIRCLSHSLSAPTLGTSSLIDSVTALLDSVSASAPFSINFSHDAYLHDILKEQKLAFYRIVQEQLNNIVKHANATAVQITLAQLNEHTILTIQDNGSGFNTQALRTGIGLNNIFSRAKACEGSVQLESQPGAGCTLAVSLPATVVISAG